MKDGTIMTRHIKRGLFPILVSFLLSSCATVSSHGGKTIPQDHLAEIIMPERQRPDIPLVMNDKVQEWIDYFRGPARRHFERYLSRSGRYIPMMRQILRQHGLPEDLVYLSMIESGFNPHAYSRARATGAWQFIYQTGLRYGLKVDSWVDERRDPQKSTVAAAKYLKDLYDRYNNWYLAAAGYNAGEGKIDRAIRKYATEDFWELARRRYLRAETKDYVPKLIAAAMIAKNPQQYGFRGVAYEEPVKFEEVTLDEPIDLRVAAKCADASYEEIKGLNPELLHWVTPPDTCPYTLRIPDGTAGKFKKKLTSLSEGERMGNERIQVASSASIRSIAGERDLPPILLAAANGLSVDDRVSKGKSIMLPYAPPEGDEFYEKDYTRKRGRGGTVIVYKVRSGDSVASISRRTGIRVASLRRNNPQIDWSRLIAGKKYRIHTGGTISSKTGKARGKGTKVAIVEKRTSSTASNNGYLTHKVQRGDTLSEIAQKYNVSTQQLKQANRISRPKQLKAGATIKIPSSAAAAGASPSM